MTPSAPLGGRRDELLVVLGSTVVATLLVVQVSTWIGGWHREVSAAVSARLTGDVVVPVLARALRPGEVVGADDLVPRTLPRWAIPDGGVRHAEEMVGRTVLERVLPGEVVRVERLADVRSTAGLEAIVPNGLRALSLNLVDDDRVSGFVEPGDWVDLLATIDGAGERPAETLLLVQAVRVLTVDTKLFVTPAGNEVHRPSVAVAVTPDEAERVAAALHGSLALKLILRSELDFDRLPSTPVVTADLLPGPRMTVAEYREQVSDQDLERFVDLVAGGKVGREPVIDIPQILHPRM